MIKDITEANESVTPNGRELAVLHEHFPACFAADGSFDIERFKEYLSDKVAVTNEGYELRFLGKNYARLLASLDTTTVIVPDEEHNNKPENAQSRNIYISGDNLDAVKHLRKAYPYGIKCIFIDPPYNTGSDGFIYNDSFTFSSEELIEKLSISEEQARRILDLTKRGSASHSAWLTFILPRLLLSRDLLAKDGAIFITIDDNEYANLKIVCDDVFGENNFLGSFIWHKKLTGGYDNDAVNTQHDYILTYARDAESFAVNLRSEDSKYKLVDEKTGKKFKWDSLWNVGGLTYSASLDYPIEAPDGTEIWPIGQRGVSFWLWSRERVEAERDSLKFSKDKYGNWKVYKKVFASEGLIPGTITLLDKKDVGGNTNASDEIKNLFDENKVFDYPKPTSLLKNLIDRVVVDGDTVLDFFSGSGSTADAVMQLADEMHYKNLHFIMVQTPEKIYEVKDGVEVPLKKKAAAAAFKMGFHTIDEIGMERIKRAAAKILNENPETSADLGFRHFILRQPSAETLDKLEKYESELNFLLQNAVLQEFGIPTVLATWVVRDGYGFTASVKTVDFDGYTGYYMDKHLYLINPDLKNEAIAAIIARYETDGSFNPENVVLYGYSFTWTETESLKVNLTRLRDTEKNLRINFDIRY
ncbi:MAG: site-specific DNA-methyltransferase [Subdoligranulum sp.]|nr:site-specific DNA-methyltransferase [Subdoligranulum sp.]